MKDSKERFSETVENYDKYRPSYPEALVAWILEPFEGQPPSILDLGSGTGISTRLFAPHARTIIGIDPNDGMLQMARVKPAPSNLRFQKGESTKTGLQDGSIDLAIAAQAFHWFDLEPTFDELARVLVPTGWCAAFWNLRASSPFLDAYEKLLMAASKEYRELSSAPDMVEQLRRTPRLGALREKTFENVQRFDRDGLFGRAYSSSYVVHGIDDLDAFDLALSEIYQRHQVGGFVDFAYSCVAVMGRIQPRM